MKRLIYLSGFAAVLLALTISMPSFAALTLESGVQSTQGTGVPTTFIGDDGIVTTIVNILLFVIGIISVIMIIIGGIRYAVSGGNSTAVTAAKNTILYAIVGLVIALFAYAIVNFVLDSIIGTSGVSGGGGSSGGNSIAPTNQ